MCELSDELTSVGWASENLYTGHQLSNFRLVVRRQLP